ncbi:NACHT and WD repeat domain-containing protein [Actinoplanes sp. HUAS TT8]|uniref:NACHT and WD repeat domain-containing protein n=1 Tax=Actinoplanes sp. HUAS TT8 TaxID=3447453 RepID=UPI003F520466
MTSVFFGFAINILTAEVGGWWGPLQPITQYPWIWVPICLLAWISWDYWRRKRSKPTWTHPGSPYPGLAPFDASRASVFFGRETETRLVLTRLDRSGATARQRFVMLVGPSGSGKSSLIRAGVLPGLSRRWQSFGPIRIGGDPFGALAAACHAGGDRNHTARRLRDEAFQDGRPDYLFALVHPETGPTLLVVDQWEDLYTRCDQAERGPFLRLMARALEAHPDLHLLAAMRPEFHPGAAAEPDLPAVDALPVVSLRPEHIREAIERPAEAAGIRFDDGLVNTMVIESTAHQADALPLLAHLLQQLHEDADGDVITTAQYNAAGRVGGAIALHADAVYRGLIAHLPREVVDSALLRGVGLESDQPVRRQVSRQTLNDEARRVLTAFSDARLMIDTGHGEAFEFAHEAFFREWPALITAIQKNRESLRRITLLERRAEAWHADGAADDLLRGSALMQAEAVVHDSDTSELVVRLVETSRTAAAADRGRSADQAAAWAQRIEPNNPELAVAVAAAAVALARTTASVLTLWGFRTDVTIVRLPIGHLRNICSMVWLGDGRLRTLDEFGKICTWSADHHHQELSLDEPRMQKPGVLSRCGEYVTGRNDRRGMGVWRLADGRYLGGRTISYLGDDAISWGKAAMFAVRSRPTELDVYQIEGPVPVHRHTLSGDIVDAFTFSPSGETLAVAGQGRVRAFRPGAWSEPIMDFKVRGKIATLAISPTGELIAALIPRKSDGLAKGFILAVFTFDGRRTASWPVSGFDPAISWSPDGTVIAYVQSKGIKHHVELRKIDDAGRVWRRQKGHPEHLAWSPDGGTVAVGGRTGRVTLWSLADDCLDELPGGQPSRISSSPGRSGFVLATPVGAVRVLDAAGIRYELPSGSTFVTPRWSPSGSVLATSADDQVVLYDSEGKETTRFGGQGRSLGPFDWSPDGSRMALSHYSFLGESRPAVSTWDVATGTMLKLMDGEPAPKQVTFDPDGRRLAGLAPDGTVLIWDSHTGEILQRWATGSVDAGALSWSPDGTKLAAAVGEEIRIWLPESTAESGRCVGYRTTITAVCWSPDSVYVAGADEDRLLVWDGRDGRPITAVRPRETGKAMELRWDGELSLITADGSVLSWIVPINDLPTDLDVEDRHRLTSEDRRHYGLLASES